MPDQAKRIPSSILIFGAAGRIGGPLAAFLQREVPQIRLRLATSHPAQADGLRRKYPSAEIVTANYFDLHSLLAAAADMEGVFVVTPSETDERPAMTNLVEALKSSGCTVHILRIVGILPEFNPRRIPKALRDHGLGLQIQHPIAKAILDESDLPVTYLNIGATYMDNFIRMGEGIRKKRTLIWPERLIPYIDPREVGEVAGRLFLSDNHRHIGLFHTLNNGHDLLRFKDVADLMSETWGEKIQYDGTKASFFEAYAAFGKGRVQLLWDQFQFEQECEVGWERNDVAERMLGRKPKTLRDWLQEHRDRLLS